MIQNKHLPFIDVAINEANKSMMSKKHGCVIIHNNKIVSKGFNYLNNDLKNRFSIHAEVAALNNLTKNKHSKNLMMYVVRIDNHKRLMQSIPCEGCKRYIQKHNISTIYYSLNQS